MTDFVLAGKVALVTGAARGIGFETARLFSGRGAAVLVCDLGDDLDETLDTPAAAPPPSRWSCAPLGDGAPEAPARARRELRPGRAAAVTVPARS